MGVPPLPITAGIPLFILILNGLLKHVMLTEPPSEPTGGGAVARRRTFFDYFYLLSLSLLLMSARTED